MRNLLAKIKEKLEILGFKIRAKHLASRMIDAICTEASMENLYTFVCKEYKKVLKRPKSEMYDGLVITMHDAFEADMQSEEETEE